MSRYLAREKSALALPWAWDWWLPTGHVSRTSQRFAGFRGDRLGPFRRGSLAHSFSAHRWRGAERTPPSTQPRWCR